MLGISIPLTPVTAMSLIAGKETMALTIACLIMYIPSVVMLVYSYNRLGIFVDNDYITEKLLFSTKTIAIKNIDSVILDMVNGARYSAVIVRLRDSEAEKRSINDSTDVSFFKMLTYSPSGCLDLKSVQLQLRKKNAWKFAKELLMHINANSNRSVSVITPDKPEKKRSIFAMYDAQSYKFWNGFKDTLV